MPVDILIVDDDRALAKTIARALEKRGHSCRMAHDGAAASEEIEKATPDAIILDLLLPKKDGRTVLRELQASESTSQVPVVAISGVFRGTSHERDLMEAGAQGYLQKPFQLAELLAHLDAVLPEPTDGSGDSERTSLAETPVADLLWRWMGSGFTGAIQFQADKLHKVLILHDGVPRQIRSNAARECLGRRLHSKGLIDTANLEESLRRAKIDGRRQGEVLVDLGAITHEQVDAELRLQAEEKVLELFSWRGGHGWSQPGVKQISYATEIHSLGARDTLLRGIEQMPRDLIAARVAGWADCRLSPQESVLSDAERALPRVAAFYRALRPDATVRSLLDAHGPVLYALQLVGGVEIVTKGVLSSNATNESEKLRELRGVERTLSSQSHYEILGVAEDATPRQVRERYVELAKRYHPDRFRSDDEQERSVAARIFALITEAQETLMDSDRREVYDRERHGGPSQAASNAEARRLLDAESLFQRAQALVKQRDYAGAVNVLGQAIDKAPEEGEIHALFGWVHFLLNRDNEQECRVALQHLERATALAEASPTGWYYLGLVHKACAEDEEAQRMFRRVLQLKPNHVEASRELRLIEMRKPTKSKSGLSGLFGFGRKKR